MRRLRILIDEELDAALAVEAFRLRTSKSALVRRFLVEGLRRTGPRGQDPFEKLIGSIEITPDPIDAVVYDT